MDNKAFSKILRRYQLGEATEAEKALVEQWYDLLDEVPTQLKDIDYKEMEERLWQQLSMQTMPALPSEAQPKGIISLHNWKYLTALAAAALIGIVLWIGGFFQPVHKETVDTLAVLPKEKFITIQNNERATKRVQLEDGTVVALEPGAQVKVPRNFDAARREVFLEGEAFFEVTSNPDQPFYVYAGKVTTHVLGTSFRIKPSGDGSRMEVSVRTGRVEVYESPTSGKKAQAGKSLGVVLTPNQKVVYHKDAGFFETSVVNNPMPLVKEDQVIEAPHEFSFSDTPLREVIVALERTYGIEIILERPALYDCPFTGDISSQNLFHKLDIINTVLGTTYEVKGTRILIKGNGCE